MMFDLVMFDLDGTLVATAPETCRAVNDSLCRFGLAPVEVGQVEHWIGEGTRELLVHAVAFACRNSVAATRTSGLLERVVQQFSLCAYPRHCGTFSTPYPHALEVLRALRRRGVKLAMVTNKELRYTQALLQRHGMAALLDTVIGGDSLPTRKPDPAGLLACLQQFEVPAARALFVGDSAIDVAAARNAGVPVWAVTHGYNRGEPIASALPDRLLPDLLPLLEIATDRTAPTETTETSTWQ